MNAVQDIEHNSSYTPPHGLSRESTISNVLQTLKELVEWKDLQSTSKVINLYLIYRFCIYTLYCV